MLGTTFHGDVKLTKILSPYDVHTYTNLLFTWQGGDPWWKSEEIFCESWAAVALVGCVSLDHGLPTTPTWRFTVVSTGGPQVLTPVHWPMTNVYVDPVGGEGSVIADEGLCSGGGDYLMELTIYP